MKRALSILLAVVGAVIVAAPAPSSSVGVSPSSPSFGSHYVVTFSTTAARPWAESKCFPNSTTEYTGVYSDGSIYGETFSLWKNGPTPQDFVLGVSIQGYWVSGGADCTVRLYTWKGYGYPEVVLATSTFTASP